MARLRTERIVVYLTKKEKRIIERASYIDGGFGSSSWISETMVGVAKHLLDDVGVKETEL